jgi:hypothetical protein
MKQWIPLMRFDSCLLDTRIIAELIKNSKGKIANRRLGGYPPRLGMIRFMKPSNNGTVNAVSP